MKTIAICIGHGPAIDKGAENKNGTTELDWTTELASMIAERAAGRFKPVIVHRVTERMQPVKETNATGAACAIELHLNAANGVASGTEMIHHSRSVKGNKLAWLLQSAAVNVLGLHNRGVREPHNGRGKRWLEQTKMPAVIVESFFIDHDSDLATGNARKAQLAQAYADALAAFVA